MGYSADDSIVRVEVFNLNGKWMQTLAVPWVRDSGNIITEFEASVQQHLKGRYCGLYRALSPTISPRKCCIPRRRRGMKNAHAIFLW